MTIPSTEAYLPGDPPPEEQVARILRVDHAGEYGAIHIYEGQLAVLGNAPCSSLLRRMRKQEQEHLAAFNTLLTERRVRPTALLPLWHLAGFVLGAATAALVSALPWHARLPSRKQSIRITPARLARLARTSRSCAKRLRRFVPMSWSIATSGLPMAQRKLPAIGS